MTPRELDRQPTIAVTRKPSFLRKAPITGPRIISTPFMIDVIDAGKQKKILVTTIDFRLRVFSRDAKETDGAITLILRK